MFAKTSNSLTFFHAFIYKKYETKLQDLYSSSLQYTPCLDTNNWEDLYAREDISDNFGEKKSSFS